MMQLSIGAASFLALVAFAIFFPETSQPYSRGVDKLRAEGHDSFEVSPLLNEDTEDEREERKEKFKWVWLNPFGFLGLLRSPNVLAVVICATVVLMSEHLLLNPLAYTLVRLSFVIYIEAKAHNCVSQGARYGIENEGLIGLCFLPSGIGNIRTNFHLTCAHYSSLTFHQLAPLSQAVSQIRSSLAPAQSGGSGCRKTVCARVCRL